MELSIQNEQVEIRMEAGALHARLWLPDEAAGVVVLAGENGGQRLRPVGDYLSSVLRDARLATLVFDFPPQAAVAGARRPDDRSEDRAEQARRCVSAACDWVQKQRTLGGLPLGLAGVGVGGNAVLQVAALLGRRVCALVARGARAELGGGGGGLARISAPTLLIAGSLDEAAVAGSRAAYTGLRCRKRFEIVPGATRAFDEPGSLEVVARLMRSWFVHHVHQTA
jgi:putative phosphoribosyl transferase